MDIDGRGANWTKPTLQFTFRRNFASPTTDTKPKRSCLELYLYFCLQNRAKPYFYKQVHIVTVIILNAPCPASPPPHLPDRATLPPLPEAPQRAAYIRRSAISPLPPYIQQTACTYNLNI